MPEQWPVLVIGATRGTGLLIAERLYQRGIPLRVFARDSRRAAALFPPAVEVVQGDITRGATLLPAINRAIHVVFTAGYRSGRPATEAAIRSTEYEGVLNALEAARRTGFGGRFLYMTSSGVGTRSLAAVLLNLYKGKTLVWRQQAEVAIRGSGLVYTIIRAGILVNKPGGARAIRVTQEPLPLSPRYRIARADVADAFVAALKHPRTPRATFEITWSRGPRRDDWPVLLDRLLPDSVIAAGS